MRFVENVNLEAIARRAIARRLAQFANLVNAAVGGRVDLDYVDRVSGANLGAGFANAARLRHRPVGRAAIQSRRQNARHGGLSNAAMPAEDVAVRGPSLFQGILQGARDVLLSDHLGELLRTIFTRQDGVAHEPEEMIIQPMRQLFMLGTAQADSRSLREDRRPRLSIERSSTG